MICAPFVLLYSGGLLLFPLDLVVHVYTVLSVGWLCQSIKISTCELFNILPTDRDNITGKEGSGALYTRVETGCL